MALDPRLILGVQQPDIIGALSSGNALAAQVNQQNRQNALSDLYREQGAGILSGDSNALAALAGLDPTQALGIQTQQRQDTRQQQAFELDQQSQRQNMQYAQSRESRAAQEYARSISAEQAAAEAAQIENAVKTGLLIPDAQQWDQVMSQQAPELVGQFNSRDALAAQYMTFAEVLKQRQGPDPMDQIALQRAQIGLEQDQLDLQQAQNPMPAFRPASAEEAAQYGAAAGQIGDNGRFYPVNPPSGFEVVTNPDGSTRVIQGPGAGSARNPSSPSSPQSMLAAIDGILSDPALDYSTGALSVTQSIPGTPMRRVGSRIRQIEGQAFLQAFESLKGGGAITEIEGQKATQAIGRLDSAQSAADYRQALGELKEVIQVAIGRQGQPAGSAMAAEPQRESVAPDIEPGIWDAMTPEEKALFQ